MYKGQFALAFRELFKAEEWYFHDGRDKLHTALVLAMRSGLSHSELVSVISHELDDISHLQRPYIMYGLTFEKPYQNKENDYLWTQFRDQMYRPYRRLAETTRDATEKDGDSWMATAGHKIIQTLHSSWTASVQAARDELSFWQQLRHCNKVDVRLYECLPRLLLPTTADSAEVGQQMWQDLPWAWH
jgi:hypothetical protein